MFTIPLGDGFTTAEVDGNLDPSLPLVVLLHGLGGSSLDMTNPIAVRGGLTFNRAAAYPVYRDGGFQLGQPALPVAGFFVDPPATTLTSWNRALVAAGFSTVAYNQSGATIAPNVTQLTALAAGALSTDSRLAGLRIVFVAHSRGGIIARSFLAAAASNPALSGFVARVRSLVTLHSPHLGSGVANIAVTVDGLLARIQAAVAAASIPPLGFLATLRSFTANPAFAELAVGSPVLAGIAAGEPVPGISYHTFGGTSTVFTRFWANAYTPDSFVPIPIPFLPFPLFHHGTTPLLVGSPVDALSFVPAAVLAPLPVVTELVIAMNQLAASTPDLAHGAGDVLVSNARAHLPFSSTITSNPLNHAEALWDPILQAQVIATLSGLRAPGVSGQAVARITPFPASVTPATHTVRASDAVTGASLTAGTVTVRDTFGSVALRVPLGTSFTFAFRGRRIAGPRGSSEMVFPTVKVEFAAGYSAVDVDTGRDF